MLCSHNSGFIAVLCTSHLHTLFNQNELTEYTQERIEGILV